MTYPSELPLISYGSSLRFVPDVRRSPDGTGGKIEQFQNTDAYRWECTVEWTFSDAELALFKKWFEQDLRFGAKPFTMVYVWGEPMRFEFLADPYVSTGRGFGFSVVTAQLRSSDAPPFVNMEDFAFKIITDSALGAQFNSPFSVQLQLDGTRQGPVIFDPVDFDSIPEWLTVGVNGLLSGTPPLQGKFTILAPTVLPPVTLGKSYNYTLPTFGGATPLSATVVDGALPPYLSLTGLTLNGTASLLFDILNRAAYDVFANKVSRIKVLTFGGEGSVAVTKTSGPAFVTVDNGVVNILPPLSIGDTLTIRGNDVLPQARIGLPYFAKVLTFGGTGNISFDITGSLPTGLTLNTATGTITGTPNIAMPTTYTFSIQATDSSSPTPQIATKTFTLNVGVAYNMALFGSPQENNLAILKSPAFGFAAFQSVQATPFHAAFSPNGAQLAVCTSDGFVRIFSTATWQQVQAFVPQGLLDNNIPAAAAQCLKVAYSPDSTRLAVLFTPEAGFNISYTNLAIYETTNFESTDLIVQQLPAVDIIYNPAGGVLYSINKLEGVAPTQLYTYNASDLADFTVFTGLADSLFAGDLGLKVSPDGQFLYVEGQGSAYGYIINTATTTVTISAVGNRGGAFSPDGTEFIGLSGATANTVTRYSTTTWAITGGLTLQTAGPITGITYSPDGSRLIATMVNFPFIRVFDSTDGTILNPTLQAIRRSQLAIGPIV